MYGYGCRCRCRHRHRRHCSSHDYVSSMLYSMTMTNSSNRQPKSKKETINEWYSHYAFVAFHRCSPWQCLRPMSTMMRCANGLGCVDCWCDQWPVYLRHLIHHCPMSMMHYCCPDSSQASMVVANAVSPTNSLAPMQHCIGPFDRRYEVDPWTCRCLEWRMCVVCVIWKERQKQNQTVRTQIDFHWIDFYW